MTHKNEVSDINVAFGINDKSGSYCRHLAATIASILENTKERINFYILHDSTLTAENKEKLELLVSNYCQKISFYNLDKYQDRMSNFKILKTHTIAATYRLIIPKHIDEIDKIIYLDCDIIFNLDIKELWDQEMCDYPVAVVRDSKTYITLSENNKLYKKIGILNSNYFNSGVMILNLKILREKYDLLEECNEFLDKYPESFCQDQDALNYIFQKKCFFMDKKFNYIVDDMYFEDINKYKDEESWKGVCWHFAGNDKPWFSKKYEVFRIYWKYLAITPWADTPNKLLKWIYLIEGEALDEIMLEQRIISRKKFIKNFFLRLYKELKEKYL